MEKLVAVKTESMWDIAEVLAKELCLRRDVVITLIEMIEKQECTIPFIARYRKEQTNGMDPDTLRNFVDQLNELRSVQKKSSTVIKAIEKQGKLDLKTEAALLHAQTFEELEHIYAPFKGEKKGSFANRARGLGLGEAADAVLAYPSRTNLRKWVTKGVEGRATLSEVETGVKHIIADLISKDKLTLDKVREVFLPSAMTLEAKLSSTRKKEMEKAKDGESSGKNKKKASSTAIEDIEKFRNYFEFSCNVPSIKSYQVLAINRGEGLKHLTVKIVINTAIENRFLGWCKKQWQTASSNVDSTNIFKDSINDAYTRLIKPFVIRKTRSDLTKQAQVAAIEVFGRNLKKLLLTPPLRGKVVLGVDPGFKNGCKCAVVSSTGNEVLDTVVIHLNARDAMQKIQRLYGKHKFGVIAIGNGTACREAEGLFSTFIARKPGADLAYCIVNENGASIYSVTPEAQAELPDMDPNLRSAVSIARRLQDPLVELVKIEPKHIGVGMYQHDIPDNLLKGSLGSVIEDCVTFVGVDLNVATVSLLGYVAGLKKTQAQNIIKHRNEIGGFVNRQQILEVKGIGEKTFQQCAGFVRISHKYVNGTKTLKAEENNNEVKTENDEVAAAAESTKGRKRKAKAATSTRKKKAKTEHFPNPLDQTWIHPESYDVAEKFIAKLHLNLDDLGTRAFIDRVKHAIYEIGVRRIAEDLSAGVPTVQLIADGLSQDAGFRDIRNEMRRPLFRRGVTSIQDLRTSTKVSGRITNVTDFGVFVDIGIGRDGLIHCSDAGGRWEEVKQCLGPNDTVEVLVKQIDQQRQRVSLRLIHADMTRMTFV